MALSFYAYFPEPARHIYQIFKVIIFQTRIFRLLHPIDDSVIARIGLARVQAFHAFATTIELAIDTM